MYSKGKTNFKTLSVFNPVDEKMKPEFITIRDTLNLPELNKTAVFSKHSLSLTSGSKTLNDASLFAFQTQNFSFSRDADQTISHSLKYESVP
jgi:hypothetical protein